MVDLFGSQDDINIKGCKYAIGNLFQTYCKSPQIAVLFSQKSSLEIGSVAYLQLVYIALHATFFKRFDWLVIEGVSGGGRA